MPELNLRLVTPEDAEKVLAVYAPFVLNTHVTFEYEVPSVGEFRRRIVTNTISYPWVVCEIDGHIVGYAYAHIHRDRPAYIWSPESSIYISEKYQSQKLGPVLYNAVFEILKLQGFVNVFAGVGLPNEKSERFHEKMGFNTIGYFENVGFKQGKWYTTHWYHKPLTNLPIKPLVPKKMSEILDSSEIRQILNKT